ncbi:MAG: hypothetical protein BRC41_14115 [Cyanobacteria bacterium QH_9_48_43]|nr:MAG: hypothetical protein BRC41_14115 [Cyanobacteria bacterium QH_9_48_43]
MSNQSTKPYLRETPTVAVGTLVNFETRNQLRFYTFRRGTNSSSILRELLTDWLATRKNWN